MLASVWASHSARASTRKGLCVQLDLGLGSLSVSGGASKSLGQTPRPSGLLKGSSCGLSWGLHGPYTKTPLVFQTPLSGQDSQWGSGEAPDTNEGGGQSHVSVLPCPSQTSPGILSFVPDTLPCPANPQEWVPRAPQRHWSVY